MIQGGISAYGVWLGRILAGLIGALLLAFVGDLFARIFNLLIGYPWPQLVHQNIHIVGVGLGAGFGAYLAWMNLRLRWYLVLGFLLLVLIAGVTGAYIGHFYGPGVDPTYWWSRFAVDTTIHLSAAIGGIIVATLLGLISDQFITSRAKPRFWPLERTDISTSRPTESK